MSEEQEQKETKTYTQAEVDAMLEERTNGLKAKADELLGEAKTAKQKARELEEAQRLAEEEIMKEKGEYKTLLEREQKAKAELAEKLESQTKRIETRELQAASAKLAAEMTRDTSRAELLQEKVAQFARYSEDGVYFEMEGQKVDSAKILAHITDKYPFLVDGNGATGGGATGGKGGSASQPKGNMGGTKAERTAAIAAQYNL